MLRKLFTLRDSADPVNKDRPIKLTYRSWHSQGSAPGKVGEGAVQRRGSFSAKVPDAYATGVLRYRVQRQNDNPEEKQKVNNLTFSYHFPNNIMLHSIFIEYTIKYAKITLGVSKGEKINPQGEQK